MKKGISKISIIIIVVIIGLLVTGIIGATVSVLNGPEKMAIKVLNSAEKEILKQIESINSHGKNGRTNLSADATLNIEIPSETKQMLDIFGLGEIVDLFNEYKYKIDVVVDPQTRNAENGLTIIAKNQNTLELKNKVLGNKKYMSIEDVTDGFLLVEDVYSSYKEKVEANLIKENIPKEDVVKEDIVKENITKEDMTKVVEGLFNAIEKSMKAEYFTFKEEKIEVEGNKVSEISINLTKEQNKELSLELLKNIKQDDELLMLLSKLNSSYIESGLTLEEIKANMDEIIADTEKSEAGDFTEVNLKVQRKNTFSQPTKYSFTSKNSKQSLALEKNMETRNTIFAYDNGTIKMDAKGILDINEIDMEYSIFQRNIESVKGRFKNKIENENIDMSLTYNTADDVRITFELKGILEKDSKKEIKEENTKDTLSEYMATKEAEEKLLKKLEEVGVNKFVDLIKPLIFTQKQEINNGSVEALAKMII